MIEFSIPNFNETIIKNIILLFLSFSNTERREVVFCTQWFIGQYCSEREGRGYRCRCTSVPLSSISSLFFSTFTTRPSISSLSLRQTDHESRRFSCQCRVKYSFLINTKYIRKNIFYIRLPIR